MEMRPGGGSRIAELADRLTCLDNVTALDLDPTEMQKNTQNTLTMVHPNDVAMDLEAVLFVANKDNPSGCRGHDRAALIPGIIDAPVEIVIREDAIVIATNAVDATDSAIIWTQERTRPKFFRADRFFKGIDLVKFPVADIAILTLREPNSLGGKRSRSQCQGSALAFIAYLSVNLQLTGWRERRGGDERSKPIVAHGVGRIGLIARLNHGGWSIVGAAGDYRQRIAELRLAGTDAEA